MILTDDVSSVGDEDDSDDEELEVNEKAAESLKARKSAKLAKTLDNNSDDDFWISYVTLNKQSAPTISVGAPGWSRIVQCGEIVTEEEEQEEDSLLASNSYQTELNEQIWKDRIRQELL